MSAYDTQEDLRRILGQPQAPAAPGGKLPNRAPIYGQTGIARMGGFDDGNGSTGTGGADGEPSPGDGKGGKDGGGLPAQGDDWGSVGGLHDCATGRCVNVNIAPMPIDCAPKNQGPNGKNYSVIVRYSGNPPLRNVVVGSLDAAKTEAAGGLMSQPGVGACSWAHEYDAAAQAIYAATDASLPLTVGAHGYSQPHNDCEHMSDYEFSATISLTANPVDTSTPPACSTMQFDMHDGTFSAQCQDSDTQLPASLSSPTASMELCDAQGNKVTFANGVRGLTVSHEKYGSTATLNPSSGRVKSVTY